MGWGLWEKFGRKPGNRDPYCLAKTMICSIMGPTSAILVLPKPSGGLDALWRLFLGWDKKGPKSKGDP